MQEIGYKLKLTSKRLKSGRCQIKFIISTGEDHTHCYGYLLAESNSTLRQVVEKIEVRLKNMNNPELFYHGHLYNLQQRNHEKDQFLLYQAS